VNEKTKTETVNGLSSLQRTAESSLQEQITALEAQEAQLYASRGHGGYIHTETLKNIRTALRGAQAALAQQGSISLRSGSAN
jgi:multidrug resistance efflux pump